MAKRDEKDFWKLLNKAAGILTAAGFLVLVIYLFSPKLQQHRKYQATVEKLNTDIDAIQEQITEIQQKRRHFLQDKDYARRVAHEHGFAEQGEVIYRFLDEPAP